MTFVKRNRARVISVLALLLCALTMFSACQEPQQSIPGSVDSISVRVMDGMDSKTITPEGNVNISHYVITVVNEAEGINQSSGYLTKGSMFTVSNVPAGTWYAKVDAYIQRGEEGSYTYVKVASDQSEPKTVQAGTSTAFELVLDTLDAVASGDVTVTLKMPAALSAESTAFWYQYTITGMTDEEFTHTSELLSGTTGADGLATITLDADAIGLMQGAYRFAITVQDAETSPTLTRKGMDVMRLVNRLEAKGTIDLSGYEADQSFEITVTDKIGDILTPSIKDGKEVYNLDGQDGSASLTVTLDEPLSDTETIEWYVDGELDETVNADEAASGKYTLTFTPGSHIVIAIIKNTDTEMSVGSIDSFIVDVDASSIEEKSIFTFSLNEDGQSYTLTGVKPEALPITDGLNIPAYYNGLPVTEIGAMAFQSEEVKSSYQEMYKTYLFQVAESLGYKGTDEAEAFEIAVTSIMENLGVDYESATTATAQELDKATFDALESDYEFLLNLGILDIQGEVAIPSSVKRIGSGAFLGYTNLNGELFLHSNVQEIGGAAFGGTGFESLVVQGGSNLDVIGYQAFWGSEIKIAIIGDGVSSVGMNAFAGCLSLQEIQLPDSIISIEDRAFTGCNGLKNIFIPENCLSMDTLFNGSSSSYTPSVYCAAESQPDTWEPDWHVTAFPTRLEFIFWNVPRFEFEAIMNNDNVPYTVPEPAISVDGGNATITCEKAFAHIYYTIDGSEPAKDNGTLYKGPFAVSDGITVKAVAYVGNDIYSTVAESSGV